MTVGRAPKGEGQGHRQLFVDGIAEGAMGRVAVDDRRNYVAIASPVASAQAANA